MQKTKLYFQRYEFKYYLPKTKADKLLPVLLNHMKWDPYIENNSENYYQVNSLYFDTFNFGCFWDKESGVSYRKKLRFRFYDDIERGKDVFLEIKRKHDALVIKDRIRLYVRDCSNNHLDKKLSELLRGDKTNDFLKEIIWFKKRNSLKPNIYISYKRKALVGKNNNGLRVTFDYDIKAGLTNEINHRPCKLKEVYPNTVVLELKYNNIMPIWMHWIIQKYQLQRISFPKYCNSLKEALPYLDDNNYSIN